MYLILCVYVHCPFQNAVPHKIYNETGFRNVLSRLAKLGLEIHITELNVPTDDPMYKGLDDTAKQQALGALYSSILSVCLEFSLCKSFELWGFTDAHNSYAKYGKGLPSPGAFYYGNNYEQKPVRTAGTVQAKNCVSSVFSETVSFGVFVRFSQ